MTIRLRSKLALLMSAFIAGITLLIAIYVPATLRSHALREATEGARSVAEMAAFNVSPALLFNDRHAAGEALRGLREDDDFLYATVRSATGTLFITAGSAQRQNDICSVSAPIFSSNGARIGTLTLAISLAGVHARTDRARGEVLLICLALFVIGVFASFALSTLITRPLQRIAETAEDVRRGSVGQRAAVTARDEVGALATAFNMMLDGLADARHELESVNHRMTLLVESTGDGIIATDAAGRCALINRAARELLGCDAHGRDLSDFIDLPEAETLTATPASLKRSDGSSLAIELSSAPIMDGAFPVGLVLSFRDVTEREMLRERLEAARRLNTLGQLAASLAHEFNNVLMSIQPFVELIRRDAGEHARIIRSCESIVQSVHRGKRVTGEVLHYTRQTQPRLAPMEAASWLTGYCAVMRASLPNGISLDVEFPPGEPLLINADREQLEQVFANLISNGRDAMQDGGTLVVRGRHDEDGAVHFEVRDTGGGMPAGIVERIFEPFFTTKGQRGTGLGLAIARQIITNQDGSIRVESTPGEGSAFHIVLPAATSVPDSAAEEQTETAAQPLSSHRILLVEDDAVVACGIESMLEHAGASVELVGEGANVLPAVQRVQPSSVVLDVGLPDMDGVDVYRELERRYPGLPVIFSTGHADPSRFTEYLERPHIRFLQKPYDGETLIAEVLKAVET